MKPRWGPAQTIVLEIEERGLHAVEHAHRLARHRFDRRATGAALAAVAVVVVATVLGAPRPLVPLTAIAAGALYAVTRYRLVQRQQYPDRVGLRQLGMASIGDLATIDADLLRCRHLHAIGSSVDTYVARLGLSEAERDLLDMLAREGMEGTVGDIVRAARSLAR